MIKKTKTAVSATAPAKENAEEGVCVYSKLLAKPFDSLEELKSAEDAYRKENAEKLKAAETRKARAQEVDDAIKHRDELIKRENESKAAAYKEYLTTIDEAKKKYLDVCNKSDKDIQDAQKSVDDKLKAFCVDYPGGYHTTIKYDDGSTKTYSYTYYAPVESPLVPLATMFDRFLRMW